MPIGRKLPVLERESGIGKLFRRAVPRHGPCHGPTAVPELEVGKGSRPRTMTRGIPCPSPCGQLRERRFHPPGSTGSLTCESAEPTHSASGDLGDPTADGAVNKRDLSTGENREFGAERARGGQLTRPAETPRPTVGRVATIARHAECWGYERGFSPARRCEQNRDLSSQMK
jgi:hypothetical protein